jgi:hypothetical protein
VDADPVELVRSGYNAISRAYRSDDDPAHEYGPWLAGLLERIPGRGQVLDIGCGCGVPVARRLAAAGHHVTGADMLYALIHMPLGRQPLLLRDIARWLRPGGWLLGTAAAVEADLSSPDTPALLFGAAVRDAPNSSTSPHPKRSPR